MREFNLEEAKNGAPVCTRDGRKARIICFDRRGNDFPIITLIDSPTTESVLVYNEHGNWIGEIGISSNSDLMMYEKPEPQFKPFDKVLVRNCVDEVWRANFFTHINDTRAHKYDCLVAIWKYCIPYEGNEHLLGTTDKPKED